jgi:hypothetical protein
MLLLVYSDPIGLAAGLLSPDYRLLGSKLDLFRNKCEGRTAEMPTLTPEREDARQAEQSVPLLYECREFPDIRDGSTTACVLTSTKPIHESGPDD